MKDLRNIVLIGMPSAGKSTIGKLLENKTEKIFVDIDDVIVKQENMSIPEIFRLKEEKGFRKIESEVTSLIAKQSNQIIATGGGIIKNKQNIDTLKENGIIIFIDRSLDKLVSNDANRPLSSSKEAVKKLYEERYLLYNKYADIIVFNNDDIETCVTEIIEKCKLNK